MAHQLTAQDWDRTKNMSVPDCRSIAMRNLISISMIQMHHIRVIYTRCSKSPATTTTDENTKLIAQGSWVMRIYSYWAQVVEMLQADDNNILQSEFKNRSCFESWNRIMHWNSGMARKLLKNYCQSKLRRLLPKISWGNTHSQPRLEKMDICIPKILWGRAERSSWDQHSCSSSTVRKYELWL